MAQQFTKKAIRDTFFQMLNDHPLSKITVKDIVLECGINRNTFYYYYEDIYAVLNDIFQCELEQVISHLNGNVSWEEGFLAAFQFALNNKKAIYHVYHSIQQKLLEKYLFEIAENVMRLYVETVGKNIPATKEDKEIIILFYQSALTGLVLKWVSDGMKEDPEANICRVGQLMEGGILVSLKRSADSNQNSND